MKNISILTCVIGEPERLFDTYKSVETVLSSDVSWTLKFHNKVRKEFIKKFEIEFVNIKVENDSSIYEAMNQGLSVLDSKYYVVIGAGDEINTKVFNLALNFLEKDLMNETPVYFFPVQYLNSTLVLNPKPAEFPLKMACPHPGSILNKEYSLNIDGYNPIYKIASDYDHLSRYIIKYGTGMIFDQILVNILAGGISEEKNIEAYLEEELIRKRVWNSSEWLIYDRMLRKSTENISHLVRQVVR